ncbi:class I SAM-dependent methyltransferase [Actinacidiphila bryophytorum]|uniref:Methyltransferase domain-containing protein n=1 Tax=Actinacidiphila bryophytorum TaxID=1436133 RepID=A0A9W4H339_9ACTN|nr:class I SAM-dependent methyltransferase [Actinacidiphila bryophytorum]MBM9437107.1 class I SAM-dependent methyltransferase [Actinacidiphila bryophytorum]MBN6542042.1 class I SAM-dependent methyltransferase [Actinacidiphila bryophytorum]CAG7646678.1 Methyltransferase domain-containing protein [Actinacidiphila bryophytorum]
MPFDHNDHYHRLLLRQLPRGARTALDVGCGTGRFARRMALRGLEVDAVDRSAEVVAIARAVSGDGSGSPRFRQADLAETGLPRGHYDAITCLASLHHMPFGTLAALRDALAPGGVLAVLGCYAEQGAADLLWSTAAVPVNAGARLAVAAKEAVGRSGAGGPESTKPPVQQPSMTLAQIRRESAELLPGRTVRRLLFWRYLLVFRNDAPVQDRGPAVTQAPRANGSKDSAQGIDA